MKQQQSNQNTTQQLMTVEQAAKSLNCSIFTLYARIKRGSLPCSKLGKRIVVNIQDVRNLTESDPIKPKPRKRKQKTFVAGTNARIQRPNKVHKPETRTPLIRLLFRFLMSLFNKNERRSNEVKQGTH